MMANSSDQAHAFVDPNMPPGVPEYNKTNNYQNEAASHDSKLKATWDDQMGPKTKEKVYYRETVVLLLSWHPEVDDLKTAEEVAALENVFRNIFHYKTEQKILTQDSGPTAQAQINLALSQFVCTHDGPNTLLIVYYAGHGKPGESNIGLNLTGNIRDQSAENSELHEVVWHSAEHIISAVKSDVLVIFDCCHAGQLERNTRSGFGRRAFEYLAATSADSTTRKPGPHSFTQAMIWALKKLVKSKKSFSTQELLHKVVRAPDFPSNQYPRLSERDRHRSCLRRIVLAPLADEALGPIPSTESLDDPAEPREDLSLRFVFNKSITEKLVSDLAIELRRVMCVDNFNMTAILWEGVNSLSSTSSKNSTANYYAHKWLQNTRKKGKRAPRTDPPQQIVPSIDQVPQLEPQGASPSPAESRLPPTPSQDISQIPLESGSSQGKTNSSLKLVGQLLVSASASTATRKRTGEEASSQVRSNAAAENTPAPFKRARREPRSK